MNRLSRILRPVETNYGRTKSIFSSRSQTLLIDLGFVRPAANGTFYLLPLMHRAVEKCTELIDRHMKKLDAQKITIPNLTSTKLWQESGRFAKYKSELFTMTDRQQRPFLLGPTFEEAATELITLCGTIHQQELPLRLYQIDKKFRDESMPRYGLLRAREFLMKDLYTFDKDKEAAMQTYQEVNEVYAELFGGLGLPFVKVEADANEMGGSISHEYHCLAPLGDEVLSTCTHCGHSFKFDDQSESLENGCGKCKANDLTKNRGIEIGHTFYLGDTYTARQKAEYKQDNGKPAILQMGCMGIGVTRLVAAAVETLSNEREIRWPNSLAPFQVCIIPPKQGSIEDKAIPHSYLEDIYSQLNSELNDSIVIDDRQTKTIGKRLIEAKCMGFPAIIVIGKTAADAGNVLFELHFTNTGTIVELSLPDLIQETIKFMDSSSK